jgi:hypothetical protein
MHEREPTLGAVSQPPEQIYEAVLISSTRDRIPIDNHKVNVYQFEDPGSLDFIEITDKTERVWLIQDDPRIHEALGQMGCKIACQQFWDESFFHIPPSYVISGGEWDIMDEADEKSLVLAAERYGTIPEPVKKEEKLETFAIPVDIPPVYYQLEGRELKVEYPNARAVEIQEFPQMSHVVIQHQDSEGRKGASVLFGDSELAELLFEEGFPYTIRRYPDGQTVSLFLNCEQESFDESAAQLLGDQGCET